MMEKEVSDNKPARVDLQRMWLWVSAIALIMASACLIAVGEFELRVTAVVFLGLAAISTNLWPYIGMRPPLKDERAARIGAMAGLVSWYVTLIVTVVTAVSLGFLSKSFNIHPTLAQGFGYIIIVMVVSMVSTYEYMIRKSDVGSI
jgi:hypothetical protein